MEFYRKVELRRRLLAHSAPGAVYVPFCGDGDLAAELYIDRMMVGCDLDPDRVAFIKNRIPVGEWFTADANAAFEDIAQDTGAHLYAVGDFDSYADPYPAFKDYWENAEKSPRQVIFLTDGQRQAIIRTKTLHHPDGEVIKYPTTNASRAAYNNYWLDIVKPWMTQYVAPWTVVDQDFYVRGASMLYCGFVLQAPASQTSRPEKEPGEREGVDPETLTDEQLGYDPLKIQGFTVAKKRLFLGHVAQKGATLTAAARAVGVTPRTVYNHFERFPLFKEAYLFASEEATDDVENALYRAALSGNVTAIQVWLYNRAPERWADKRQHKVELQTDDAALKLISDILARTITDPDTLARIRAEFARIAASGLPS